MLDIHSHVLPGVDDGAKDAESALALLSAMKEQGITDVIATPHFYPQTDTLEEFQQRVSAAYRDLQRLVAGKGLPRIFLGSEVLYFPGIGHCASISDFCLNRSRYLLLELCGDEIGPGLFEDLLALRWELNITPIIAHIERYHRASGYRKLLRFVEENNIYAQLNASSLFIPFEKKIAYRLIRQSIVQFLGTDAHSVDLRPPQMQQALAEIEKKFGQDQKNRFLTHSQFILKEITASMGETL